MAHRAHLTGQRVGVPRRCSPVKCAGKGATVKGGPQKKGGGAGPSGRGGAGWTCKRPGGRDASGGEASVKSCWWIHAWLVINRSKDQFLAGLCPGATYTSLRRELMTPVLKPARCSPPWKRACSIFKHLFMTTSIPAPCACWAIASSLIPS